jgi:hypothetical protein
VVCARGTRPAKAGDAELFDRWLGHADVFPQEEQDRLLVLALVDEGLQPVRKVRGRLVLSEPQRRLGQAQVGHRYALGRREQRQHRARRMSEDNCGTADRVDDSAQILRLPLGCVRRGVAAVAPTATIVGDALQARLGERGSQRTSRPRRRQRAPDEDHRSSGSEAAISDPGTVGGFRILDRLISQNTMSSLSGLLLVSADTFPQPCNQRAGGDARAEQLLANGDN